MIKKLLWSIFSVSIGLFIVGFSIYLVSALIHAPSQPTGYEDSY